MTEKENMRFYILFVIVGVIIAGLFWSLSSYEELIKVERLPLPIFLLMEFSLGALSGLSWNFIFSTKFENDNELKLKINFYALTIFSSTLTWAILKNYISDYIFSVTFFLFFIVSFINNWIHEDRPSISSGILYAFFLVFMIMLYIVSILVVPSFFIIATILLAIMSIIGGHLFWKKKEVGRLG